MEQGFIDKLINEDLQIYATSPQIVGTVMYAKVNSEDEITYLSEDVAVKELEIMPNEMKEKIQELESGEGMIGTQA